MTLLELIQMTRTYCRDNNSLVFPEADIKVFVNQAIDRVKQYKVFSQMPYLQTMDSEVQFLPVSYQYMLALFAASRCFDADERFYEGIEKRNEFESVFSDLINEIEAENVTVTDEDGDVVDDRPNYVEYITDAYFNTGGDDDATTFL